MPKRSMTPPTSDQMTKEQARPAQVHNTEVLKLSQKGSSLHNNIQLLPVAKDNDLVQAQQLLDAGASPNSSNQIGQTALHLSAVWGSLEVGSLLIAAGANVSPHNRLTGATPLHLAAQRRRAEMCRFLVSKSADVNAKDNRGKTPYDYSDDNEIRELLAPTVNTKRLRRLEPSGGSNAPPPSYNAFSPVAGPGLNFNKPGPQFAAPYCSGC
jgi:ankyrin repeat protein